MGLIHTIKANMAELGLIGNFSLDKIKSLFYKEFLIEEI